MSPCFKIFALILLSIITTGCADNVKRYKTDPSLKQHLQPYALKSIELQSVKMPKGDSNGVMCRMNSMISLPDKMVYSTYVKDALQKSLLYINNQDSSCSAAHKLDVVLTNVSVNTLKAQWYIDADVSVDNNKPIALKTTTDHNFSYMAMSACYNASNAFDEAVDHFIKELLTHPQISKQLK